MAIAEIGAAALAATAFAGPNRDAIHDAEAHHEYDAEEHALPLGHGPRAISTPWLNKVQAQRCAAHKRPLGRRAV